jgi:uncharacterized protein
MPDDLILDWVPQSLAELQAQHFEALHNFDVQMLLLGTGARLRFPDSRHLAPLYERGIGVEVMDTPAACRTYNILMAEGRQVAAALLID